MTMTRSILKTHTESQTDSRREVRILYRVAAIAAALSAVLIPIQVGVFAANPYPETAGGWLQLVADKPFIGLVDLDALLVVDNLLLVPIVLAIWIILRPVAFVAATAAVALSLLSIGLMVASNPAVEMLQLSDRFTTTTGADRVAIKGAAEAALARWEGTGFQVAYVIGQLGGIILGELLLNRALLGRAVPYAMIAGNAIGFAYYLPKVGLGLSALSGVVL
jgi:hypothetical protein